VTRIRALLRRAAIKSDATASADDVVPAELRSCGLRLVPASRSVYVDGKPVVLTGVEYDLLSLLVRYKGQVRTREQLLKEVRNREFELFDRAIDVHIASLRKKLGDDSRSARFIRTVRAVGYLFIDPQDEY
jgi:DNA-binding response OmpR family regulator